MKSDLSKHLKPIIKSFIVVVGLLIIVFSLLLLHEVYGRSKLVSPSATPIFTDRYGTFLAEGACRRERTARFLGSASSLAGTDRFVPIGGRRQAVLRAFWCRFPFPPSGIGQ